MGGDREEVEGTERGEIVIRIYYMRQESILRKRGKGFDRKSK